MHASRLEHGFLPALACAALLAACSSGSSDGPAPAPPPPIGGGEPDFAAVRAAVDAFAFDDVVLLIGDETGELYRYEKGLLRAEDVVSVASASKMISGLGVWRLVEAGDLNREDAPQDHLVFWETMEPAGRSGVTLDHLLGFVSGFNNAPTEPGCIGDGVSTLPECVTEIHDGGIDTAPGASLYYGPEHLQIAALMAVEAVGATDFGAILRDRLFDPAGVSASTRFSPLAGDNPRYAGGLGATAEDYGRILTGVLSGALVSDLAGYLEDRTASATVGYRPDSIDANNLDWRYGAGFWIECDAPVFQAACATTPTISSPGAFGFTPWIDFGNDYWGVIAMQAVATANFRPAEASVLLEQELQPLIETALSGG